AAELMPVVRGVIVVLLALIGTVFLLCLNAQAPPARGDSLTSAPANSAAYEITGVVRNGKTLLPGVTVTASNTLTGNRHSTETSANGRFRFKGLPRGRYVVRIEFMGFAPLTEEVVLKPETPSGHLEAELILASRQQGQPADTATQAARHGFQSLA